MGITPTVASIIAGLSEAGGAVAGGLGSAASAIGSGLGTVGSFLGGTGAGTLSGTLGSGLTSLGVGDTTAGILGNFGAGALTGAAEGAAGSAILGGDPLKGAELGGITGGVLQGSGPLISNLAGTAAGAGAGAGGAAATAPSFGAVPISSTLDPTVAAAQVSPTSVASQLFPTAGVSGGGITTPTGFYGGGPDLAPTTGFNTAPVDTSGTGLVAPSSSDIYSVPPTPVTPNATPTAASPAASPAAVAAATGAGPPPILSDAETNPFQALTPQNALSQTIKADEATQNAAALANVAGQPMPTSFPTQSAFMSAVTNPTMSNIGDALNANPQIVAGMLGLGTKYLQGSPQGLGALKTQSQAFANQAQALESYLNTGTLPSGLQAGLNQSVAAAKQKIKADYAAKGMSGSSAEASDLAYADVNAQAQKGQMEMQLLAQGLSAGQLSIEELKGIVDINQKQQESVASTIAQFASALNGQPLQMRTGTG